jgi:hypothetical protein
VKLAIFVVCAAFVFPAALRGDLGKAMAEKNLEKRSKLALENADGVLKLAREAYGQGEMKQAEAMLVEVRDSVALAMKSLQDTGKNPRKSPKWFKRAEIGTRDLLRKLDAFEQEMSVMDRTMIADAKGTVQKVHEELLLGVMEGKPK